MYRGISVYCKMHDHIVQVDQPQGLLWPDPSTGSPVKHCLMVETIPGGSGEGQGKDEQAQGHLEWQEDLPRKYLFFWPFPWTILALFQTSLRKRASA